MSDKDKNLDVNAESQNESADETKSNEEAVKAESAKSNDSEQGGQSGSDKKLQEDFTALKGVVSGKDKQLQETQKTLQSIQEDLQATKNQLAVKDLLIESELPQQVREALKADILELTPDNFQAKADKYMTLFEGGKKEYETKAQEFVGKKAESQVPADFAEKINNAKTPAELDEILKQGE